MNPELQQALSNYLLAMADDELILGHRNSEWCGHAPIIEEDIAFANIALDEIGHAIIWYELLADLQGEEREAFANRMVYFRNTADFRCAQMVELPKGDWAFTMLRQYLFDQFEILRLEKLAQSNYAPIAEAAAKILKEERYHLRHTKAWVRRLGLGTEESRRRMQTALNQLWPYYEQFFMPIPDDHLIFDAGMIPFETELMVDNAELVIPFLIESSLIPPQGSNFIGPDDVLYRYQHTDYLTDLLNDLQQVARLDMAAKW
jgi:ring-1,2-phenylacetyl-CoA epoxidase subunit PaaC